MKSVILVLAMLIINILDIYGQSKKQDYPDKKYYKKAILTLYDQSPRSIKNISFDGDTLSFIDQQTYRKEKISIYDIEEIKVKTKTAIIGGAVLGAVLPTIFILESLIDNTPNADNAGVIAASIIGGGAIIGAAIGYSIPIWKTYHFGNKQKTDLSINYMIHASPYMLGTTLVFNF